MPQPIERRYPSRGVRSAGGETQDDRLVAAWTRLLGVMQDLNRESGEAFVACGVTAHELAVLDQLARSRFRSLSTAELAARTGIRPLALNHWIERLEARDLLRREVSRTVAGVVHAVLTPQGYTASRRVGALHRKAVAAVVGSRLGPDGVEVVTWLCDRLSRPADHEVS